MKVLGITTEDDGGAAVIVDGQILSAINEERPGLLTGPGGRGLMRRLPLGAQPGLGLVDGLLPMDTLDSSKAGHGGPRELTDGPGAGGMARTILNAPR